jgi:ferredoxin
MQISESINQPINNSANHPINKSTSQPINQCFLAMNPLMLPSTKALVRESRTSSHRSWFNLFHGYVYGRWPFWYISVGTGEHPLARWIGPVAEKIIGVFNLRARAASAPANDTSRAFADEYHGKVVRLKDAIRLVNVDQDVTLRNLEKVIPYARARDIILRNPDHIAVLECPCRSAREHPCEPLDVCIVVGEPFSSFILEHHPKRARRITPAEAVEILRAEDERGHVHHAFFKDAMLGRFYAICNCCACCCGAMQAHRAGTPMLASSGYRNTVNMDLCAGCGECNDVCQFHALEVVDGKNHVHDEKCMGCGVCASKCTHGALALLRDPSRGEPLEIHELMRRAAETSQGNVQQPSLVRRS